MLQLISNAKENKYVFIGCGSQNHPSDKAYIIECGQFEDNIQISDTGEIYLKIDKIGIIPAISPSVTNVDNNLALDSVFFSYIASTLNMPPFNSAEDRIVYCSNPKCRRPFIPTPANKGRCPWCGTQN